jgi:hypothetical protein
MAGTSPSFQATIVDAAAYASVFLQMAEHLFPDRSVRELSEDDRSTAHKETDQLLVRSKWRLESSEFTDPFMRPRSQ